MQAVSFLYTIARILPNCRVYLQRACCFQHPTENVNMSSGTASVSLTPLLLMLLGSGCVQTKAAVLDVSAQRAPICSNGVKLYPDSASVGQPWELIAILTSTGQTGSTSVAGMMNSQRQKAAPVGANGVILGHDTEPGSGAKVAGAFLGTGTQRTGDAKAILVPGDSERVARACNGTQNRAR